MPILDANKSRSRAAQKKIDAGRKKRIKAAQHDLTSPKPTTRPSPGSSYGTQAPEPEVKRSGQTPDRERRDAIGRGAQQRQAQRVLERDTRQSVRRIFSHLVGLHRKERAVQRATQIGLLDSTHESGATANLRLDMARADAARMLQRLQAEHEAEGRAAQRQLRGGDDEIVSGAKIEELRAGGKLPSMQAGLGPSVGDPLHLTDIRKGAEHATLKVLDIADRPGNAVRGAIAGKNVLRHLSGKEHTTGTEILGETLDWHPKGIVGKIARTASGFVLDVGADPLTYATFGAASVAKTAAQNAERAVIRAAEKDARKILKQGGPGAADRVSAIRARAHSDAAHAAAEAARKHAGKGRGVQVGVRIPFRGSEHRTSGRSTAAVGRVVNRGTKAAPGGAYLRRKVRAGADRVLPHIAPDFKRAGISDAEHQGRRRAATQLRARVHRGQAQAAHVEQSLRAVAEEHAGRHLKIGPKRTRVRDQELRDITATVERAPVKAPAGLKYDKQKVTVPVKGLKDSAGNPITDATKTKRVVVVKTAKGKNYEQVRKRLEKQTTPHTDVVETVRQRNAARGAAEVAHKILKPKQVEKYEDRYVHQGFERPEDNVARREENIPKRRGSGVSHAPSKARRKETDYMSAREKNALRESTGLPERFEERIDKIEGQRELSHQQRVARAEYVDKLLDPKAGGHAIPVNRATVSRLNAIPENFGVFRRTSGDAIEELSGDEIKALTPSERPDGKTNAPKKLKKNETIYIANRKNTRTAMEQIERPFRKSGIYRRVSGRWKSTVTMFNPSYHVGNEIGNRVMAWQADTGMKSWNESRRAVNLLGGRNKFERTADAARGKVFRDTLGEKDKALLDLIEEGEKHGALSGGFTHELQDLRGHRTHRVARFGERRENHMRLASYIEARTRRGMSPENAAEWVNKHHIDYGDLSPAEQALRDAAIPFYTFTARNARLQVAKLLQRPGKAASFEKLRDEMNQLAGEDPDFAKALKRYQQAGAPFVLGFGAEKMLFFARTPIEQGLGMIPSNPGDVRDQVLNRLNPIFKMPIEAMQNYSMFFRSEIEPEDPNSPFRRVPAPVWASVVERFPLAKDLLQIGHDKDGKLLWRPGATWAMGIAPQAKAGGDLFIGADQMTQRGQTPAMAGASFIGFKLSDLNRALLSAARQRSAEERDELDALNGDENTGFDGKTAVAKGAKLTESQERSDRDARIKELNDRISQIDRQLGYKPKVDPDQLQSFPKSREQLREEARAKREALRSPAGRAKLRHDAQIRRIKGREERQLRP